MTKMKCRQCEHFEECRNKNIILDATTSSDYWYNAWEHVYIFGLVEKIPSYCPVKEVEDEQIHGC